MCSRRTVMLGGAALFAGSTLARATVPPELAAWLAEAFRQRQIAIDSGDQAFGAVMVLDGRIIGLGPSRVVLDRDPEAHAERVALRAAQRALDRQDLAGALIVSTSRPCTACQEALARANVAKMIHGADAIDAGRPGRG